MSSMITYIYEDDGMGEILVTVWMPSGVVEVCKREHPLVSWEAPKNLKRTERYKLYPATTE